MGSVEELEHLVETEAYGEDVVAAIVSESIGGDEDLHHCTLSAVHGFQ